MGHGNEVGSPDPTSSSNSRSRIIDPYQRVRIGDFCFWMVTHLPQDNMHLKGTNDEEIPIIHAGIFWGYFLWDNERPHEDTFHCTKWEMTPDYHDHKMVSNGGVSLTDRCFCPSQIINQSYMYSRQTWYRTEIINFMENMLNIDTNVQHYCTSHTKYWLNKLFIA